MNDKAETVQLDDRDVLRVEAAINVGEDKADQLRYHTVKLYGRKKRARERKLGMNNKAETVQLDDRDVLRVEAAINVGEDKADQLRYYTVK